MGALAIEVDEFGYWISAVRWNLTEMQGYGAGDARRSCLRLAAFGMNQALRAANKAGCRARKALCLRVLNWIRADLRRAS